MSLLDVVTAIDEGAGEPRAFAVIGAMARNAWAPPRATADLDLAVSARPEVLERIARRLESLGYRCVREQRADASDSLPDILIFRTDDGEPPQVDVLVAKTAFEEAVIGRAEVIAIGHQRMPVATPEDLVVYKLLADRPRDRDDIRAVLRTQERAGRPFDWEHVERWAAFWKICDRLNRVRASLGPADA